MRTKKLIKDKILKCRFFDNKNFCSHISKYFFYWQQKTDKILKCRKLLKNSMF
jgi:hypothetical protein